MLPPLRRATAADLPAVAKLMNLAFRGTGAGASWNVEAGFIDGDRTSEAALEEEIAANPDGVMLVVDNVASGSLEACVWLQPASGGTWYLGSLTVDPRLQKSGRGRDLLAAAERWASHHGATAIEMTVVNVRSALIAWYERRGYHLTGERRPFPYGDDRFGVPRRDDLEFVVLARSLAREDTDQPLQTKRESGKVPDSQVVPGAEA